MGPSSHYLVCAGREIHFTLWGQDNSETVVAWHGLARTGRDMDYLASSLADRYRVVCPDTVGRGLSEWSAEPANEYCLDFYGDLAESLIDQLGISQLSWVGTSMGGAIGIKLAGGALSTRIRRLVLNDIGPKLGESAVARIRTYAGSPPQFARVSELEEYFRTVYKPYGWLSDDHWRHLTATSTRRTTEGKVTPHYDPNMVMQFSHHPHDYELWESYDRIIAPTLCLRGESSDLLLPETAEEMRTRGPGAVVVTIAGCGHAPALNVPEQIGLVRRFLNGTN
jgi:pimeloyl-ACP methyl ester carboxylesterase